MKTDVGAALRIPLAPDARQEQQLQALQVAFAEVCNTIYAVSRTCHWVFQSEGSRYHVSAFRGQSLQQLHLSNHCPVYLDRNTFSLKQGRASFFTLDEQLDAETVMADETLAYLAVNGESMALPTTLAHGRITQPTRRAASLVSTTLTSAGPRSPLA